MTRSDANQVCIVAPGHPASNPRVVKEADALAAAGYRVRLVSTQYVERIVPWDWELAAGRPWRYAPINWTRTGLRPRVLRYWTGARQRLCAWLARRGCLREPVPELAAGRLYRELLAAALREPADLFIAHYVAALPVAARAAARQGVPFAFDAEDDHLGEFTDPKAPPARLVDHIQAKYLPRCAFVTAASAGIADTLAAQYGVERPTPLHNVFPWSDRAGLDGLTKDRRGPALSLFWFSQVVGLDRGLQDVLRAAALVRGGLQIHVRGRLENDVRAALDEVVRGTPAAEQVFYHPPVPPHELLSRTAEHDVGLALEQPVSRNRLQTCTNKIFFYLLAGLAVAATDTPGQRPVMEATPGAGFLYPPGDFRALAAQLQQFVDAPERLRQARQAALAAARDRWNWERESERLLALVARTLGRHEQPPLVPQPLATR